MIEQLRDRKTILVLEDDPGQQALYRLVLEDEGYRVHLAKAVRHAVTALTQGGIHAIIADFLGRSSDPPDLAFLDPVRLVAPDVPIILSSAQSWAQGLDPERHRLFAVVLKPFDLEHLLDTVARAVQRCPHL